MCPNRKTIIPILCDSSNAETNWHIQDRGPNKYPYESKTISHFSQWIYIS